MKKYIKYVMIDGRGEHENFKDCITQAIKDLKDGQGIQIIKDFEPFPMYKMMEEKGFDRYVEKVSDEEYHAYFTPKEALKGIEMGNHLDVDMDKIRNVLEIKVDFLRGKISKEEAHAKLKNNYSKVTPQEFAICEQYAQDYGITDEELTERMEEILEVFEGILVSDDSLDLPTGHPVRTYIDEVVAIRKVLKEMKDLLKKEFVKNPWLEVYEKLDQINIHFARKQNQLFSALEGKGFDKPSKIMWTLDNNIRDIIKTASTYLKADKDEAFLNIQQEIIDMVEDMMVKEVEILLPTSMDLLSEEDFIKMRIGDDEIGYCLIDKPAPYGQASMGISQVPNSNAELLSDLAKLLQKHGVHSPSSNDGVLDVSQGKLTLEQLNLIFKHLQVDLSYVDEYDIVKFYSDTKHRVFPRSAGVIGREVKNCHPRESVSMVEEIVRAFKAGEQDEAEFWLEMGGKFIYIIYTAVRDEEGNFRGVLEMMQDATRVRNLTGSQRLLSWDPTKKSKSE